MILILGKSDLSIALEKILENTVIVGKPEYDFSLKEDCDKLVALYTPNVVINTFGVIDNNLWNTLTVNYISPVYLTLKFYEKMNSGSIINISSAATFWVSYPGIDTTRLCYNLSKEALSTFGNHVNRQIIDDTKNVTITTIEPGKFSSKFNKYTQSKIVIDKIAETIKYAINNSITNISIIK